MANSCLVAAALIKTMKRQPHKKLRLVLLALVLTLPTPAVAQTPASDIESSELEPPAGGLEAEFATVKLRGLNKVTAKTSELTSPVGTTMRFGTLDIAVHRCWNARPEERPEHAALLEILELKQGENPQRIFLGWMFASSPGLSSLEHPVYDITVLKCESQKEDNALEQNAPDAEEPAN